MVSSAQPTDQFAPTPGKISHRGTNSWAETFYIKPQQHLLRLYRYAGTYLAKFRIAQGIVTKIGKVSVRAVPGLRSVILKRLPSLPMLAAPGANVVKEVDPVELVLSDFEKLSTDHQDKVAKSLALLWDTFIDAFGGVSGFQATSATEQQAYLGKLEAAAHRMQAARGSEVAFHYVTVEFMRHYISFLQIGSVDSRAILLAKTVAPLIDSGRGMKAKAIAA